MDRVKLIELRNNVQAYLNRIEQDEAEKNVPMIISKQISEDMRELKKTIELQGQPQSANIDFDDVIDAIKSLEANYPQPIDRTDDVIKAVSEIRFPEINYPKQISVDNFPPQKIPNPVTNININGLKGPIKSTAVSVDNTITPLPTTPLENRRSLIVYNNGEETIYIGDESVTTLTGIPVCKQNYSPALDLGEETALYAIADPGPVDVRVLESSL